MGQKHTHHGAVLLFASVVAGACSSPAPPPGRPDAASTSDAGAREDAPAPVDAPMCVLDHLSPLDVAPRTRTVHFVILHASDAPAAEIVATKEAMDRIV